MQILRSRLRPYLGSRDFYKSALGVMIPVTIQQLINNLFNMVDNLMVGSLDPDGLAMSAVTVANKPYSIFFGVFFGMTGAAGLLISQYYGARDLKTCQRLFSLQMVIGLMTSLIFGAALALLPTQVMHLFVTDGRTVELGVSYISIIWLSYIPAAVSNTCIFSLRSLGKNRASMLVSLMTMALNALFNYAFIFGKLGSPAMGVRGAALGTLAARLCEMGFYLVMLARRSTPFCLDMKGFSRLERSVTRSFALKAVPLISNEILWTCGLSVFFWSYARLNEAALPAITIGEQCNQIASVMAMGTSSAVSVLIGAELGANRLRQAKANCKKLLTLVLGISLCCVTVCCLLAFILPNAFGITPALRAMATRICLIMGLLAPMNFVYGFCFYCMRAGGDTKSAMLLDSGYMWLVPVPASVLLALTRPGGLGVEAAVFVVQFLMNVKVILALAVLRRGRWVRNITGPA